MSTAARPRAGDVLAGKYEIEDVLGTGGMGVVVAARDLMLRRRVAVKFLLADATRLPGAVERFLREARAVVAIQSEHVARVIEVGTLEDGAPYMVMEHLTGTDFAKLLKRRGPLPIDEVAELVLQAGEAIAEAHALGIVHRDLKPANLFLTTRTEGTPLVKVLDFGLSKMEAQEGEAPEASLTATGFVAGSPQYMSPEQVRSLKNIDWRTDIWALGVILYEMLTGRRPFDGPSLTAVCVSIGADAPRPPRELRAEIPPELEAAVMGCLEKDRTRRVRSVAELAQALARFAPAHALGSVQRIVRLLPGDATVQLPLTVQTIAPVIAPVMAGAAPMVREAIAREVPAVVAQSAPVVVPSAPDVPAAPEAPEAPSTAQASAWGTTGAAARRAPGVIAGVVVAGVGLAALGIGGAVWVLGGATRGGVALEPRASASGPLPTASVVTPASPGTATAEVATTATATAAEPPAAAEPTVVPVVPSASASPSASPTVLATAEKLPVRAVPAKTAAPAPPRRSTSAKVKPKGMDDPN